ncbi:hypothetical protein TNCV_2056921 [Trichonephila clavipes]|nr:hypothetical protein TNCV_2056921 [Trichonephila clavipes]
MATGSSLTQNYSRSQSEIQGDLHNLSYEMSPDLGTARTLHESYIGDGPRNFEPLSRDEDDTSALAPFYPSYHTTPTGGH